jgi:hypothetical protein
VARTVADQFAETLAAAGVKRIWGIVGDSLNGLTDALRREGSIRWMPVRHEEVAAFAAGAEAHVTGQLAVCAGSCGPGNLHLINGLFDCHRSHVPVLAIAAHIPSAEIGSNYFQETHPRELFRECSHYCELVSGAHQMPRTLEIAIREAGDAFERGTESAGGRAERHEARNAAVRLGLRGRTRPAPGVRRAPEGTDRARPQRKRTRRVEQSLRRRHDRADRFLVGLLRHARLRSPADAGQRLPVSAVLSARYGAHRTG